MQTKIRRSKALTCLQQEMKKIKNSYPGIVGDVMLYGETVNGEDLLCGDGFSVEHDGKIYVVIGSCDFPSKWHMYVDTSLFCEMMLAVKHEQ